MPQTTEFPLLPNTHPAQLLLNLVRLSGHLEREQPEYRALRTTMREWNMWDKERSVAALRFLHVPADSGTAIGPGPLLMRLMAVDEESDQRKLLARYIFDCNPLLVKTVFDGLDTENDGRIQSTNELYRLITSYVYTGEYITLPEFKNWITWMDATHVIRLVGIRWGLGALGEGFAQELRQIDMEELTEDLDEGRGSPWSLELEPATSAENAAKTTVSAPPLPMDTLGGEGAPKTVVSPTPPPIPPADAGAQSEEEEDAPDMPPEPSLPSEDAVRAAAEAIGVEPEAVEPTPAAKLPRAAPAQPGVSAFPQPPVALPPRSVRAGTPPPAPVAPVLIAPVFAAGSTSVPSSVGKGARKRNVENIRTWWSAYTFRHPHRAVDFGVDLIEAAGSKDSLTELACASLFANCSQGPSAGKSAFAALRTSGALEAWIKGEAGIETSLEMAGLLGLVGGDRRFLGTALAAYNVCRRQLANPLAPSEISTSPSSEAVQVIYEGILGQTDETAPFWVARELVLAGVADDELRSVACVPSRATRENAYRLGLLDRLYAHSLTELTELSRVLGDYLDEEMDFNAPLDHLQDQLGCRFRCPFAEGCDYNCRERVAV